MPDFTAESIAAALEEAANHPLTDPKQYPTDPLVILNKTADRLYAHPEQYLPLVDGRSLGAKDADGNQTHPTAENAVAWDIVGLMASVSYGNTEDSAGIWQLTTDLFGVEGHAYNLSLAAAAEYLLGRKGETAKDADDAFDALEARIAVSSPADIANFLREVAASDSARETVASFLY